MRGDIASFWGGCLLNQHNAHNLHKESNLHNLHNLHNGQNEGGKSWLGKMMKWQNHGEGDGALPLN